MRKLLLLSNSTNVGEEHLGYAKPAISGLLGKSVKEILFVPYAAVGFNFDDYTRKVNEALNTLGYHVRGLHQVDHAREAVEKADAIMVGGGNTFALLKRLYDNDVIEAIVEQVNSGTPYVGWSAGSNVAGPSIKTTNDMPIVQPSSFEALNLVPFQINPHYTEKTIANHGGESRKDRLNEFIELNPGIRVVGLPEGNLIEIKGGTIQLFGAGPITVFRQGDPEAYLTSEDNLDFLLAE